MIDIQNGWACDAPGCSAVGEHICLAEILTAMMADEDFLDAVWDFYLLWVAETQGGEQ